MTLGLLLSPGKDKSNSCYQYSDYNSYKRETTFSLLILDKKNDKIKKPSCQENCFCDRIMFVDVSVLSKDSIKIKGRSSSFVIDPTAQIQEVGADAAVFLKDIENPEVGKVTDYRVIIKGAGEYEVAGTRILGTKSDDNFYTRLT